MNYEQAIKDLQDNLVVIAEIERRQSAIPREHAESRQEPDEYQRRINRNLAEITQKLNRLINRRLPGSS